jgi:prepilin peptidase CpaA
VTAEASIGAVVGVAAVIDDLARRQISNWIPAVALVAGAGCQVAYRGWMGLLIAIGGAICGFGVFLIFYLLGGMGGGDVKLMAGFGALLGTGRILEAALWTAGIGGIFAALVLGFRALKKKPVEEEAVQGDNSAASIPYAPAITLGVWLALIPK